MTKPRTQGVSQSYGLDVSQLQEDTRKLLVRTDPMRLADELLDRLLRLGGYRRSRAS